MTKVVLIGLPGDTQLWMVDLDNKTVTTVPAEYVDQSALGPRPLIKGVEIAVALGGDTQNPSGKFDTVQMLLGK